MAELYQNPLRLALHKSSVRVEEMALSMTVGGLMGRRYGGGHCDCDCHDDMDSDDEDVCDDCEDAECWSGGYWRSVPTEREVSSTIIRDMKEVYFILFFFFYSFE